MDDEESEADLNTNNPAKRIKQDALNAEVEVLEREIAVLQEGYRTFKLTEAELKTMKSKMETVSSLKKDIKRLEKNRIASIKKRQTQKAKASGSNTPRNTPGRPRLTEEQPEMLNAIVELARFGGSADPRRRTEGIRTILTLNDLHAELKLLGYNISRSSLYTHLLPANIRRREGKSHIETVPVRLIRARNDLHKGHADTWFAKASIDHTMELASFMGPGSVMMLSLDDKSRVPLGITSAKVQQSILMHMEYRVKLPDHDFVVAEKHKLIPSVYAGLVIKPGGFGTKSNVTYSGK